MERRFDMSDFERSLKAHADQFKLMPSKRVWNGIYNHLHPGSKWPSISIAIVFLITLVSIGNLNNSPKKFDKSSFEVNSIVNKKLPAGQLAANILQTNRTENNFENKSFENSADIATGFSNHLSKKTATNDKKIAGKQNQVTVKEPLLSGKTKPNTTKLYSNGSIHKKNLQLNKLSQLDQQTEQDLEMDAKGFDEKISSIHLDFSKENLLQLQNHLLFSGIISPTKNDVILPVDFGFLSETEDNAATDMVGEPSSKQTAPERLSDAGNITDLNSQNNETSTSYHLKSKTKKNKNVEWTFYAAPTIGLVSFNKQRNQQDATSNVSSVIILPNNPSFGLRRTAKLGFEMGAEMSYKISKKFRFITGANMSYSGYNNVSNLIHPTFASLTFVDKYSGVYSKSYVTNYGNGQSPNQIPLTNYSFETSVPIGLQYNIWSNEKIQVDAVSTVDPSVVLKKNAFVISSDGRNYINDPSLVRNVNLAGHFGTYITFSAEKIKWHIGPDVRYQLLSTYKGYYPAKEHFIDYGIRIGISR